MYYNFQVLFEEIHVHTLGFSIFNEGQESVESVHVLVKRHGMISMQPTFKTCFCIHFQSIGINASPKYKCYLKPNLSKEAYIYMLFLHG